MKVTPFKIGCLVVLAACLLFSAFGGRKSDLLTSLDNRITDAMFRWRGPAQTTGSVVIVDIDEKSLKELGQWPWPRRIVARLIRTIQAAEPKVIGLDIVFAEADRTSPIGFLDHLQEIFKIQLPNPEQVADPEVLDYDLALGNALAGAPTVLGYLFQLREDGFKEAGQSPFPSCRIKLVPEDLGFDRLPLIPAYRPVLNVPEVARGQSEGFFNVFTDTSGTVRKVPLLMGLDHLPHPSLALEMFRIGQAQAEITIRADAQTDGPKIDIRGITVGSQLIPTDENGQISVNFRGQSGRFVYLSASDVLRGQHQTALNEKYVLIGTSAAGLFDLVATPFSSAYAGVEVHATIIDNLVAGDCLTHDRLTEIGVSYALMIIGGLVLSLMLAYGGPLLGALGGSTVIAAVVACNYRYFFLNNMLVGITYPFFALIAILLVVTGFNYFNEGREKRFIRSAFSHYVSPQVVNQLLSSPDKLSLKGEQKVLTVLFSDIRGFTTISERMSSEELGLFMNEYLTTMSNIVMAHGGTLDKFIGDAIMAIWGAPLDDPDHAPNAVRAAIAMMNQLKKTQSDYARRGLPFIDIGVGINTGVMSVGNFGTRERFDYTVMGDNVNLASRLEGLNKSYGTHIIISEFTRKALGDRFFCRYIDRVTVKGKNEAVSIYEPLVEGKPNGALRAEVDYFEHAIVAYRSSNIQLAHDALEQLQRRNPDGLYAFYLQRMETDMAKPLAKS